MWNILNVVLLPFLFMKVPTSIAFVACQTLIVEEEASFCLKLPVSRDGEIFDLQKPHLKSRWRNEWNKSGGNSSNFWWNGSCTLPCVKWVGRLRKVFTLQWEIIYLAGGFACFFLFVSCFNSFKYMLVCSTSEMATYFLNSSLESLYIEWLSSIRHIKLATKQ